MNIKKLFIAGATSAIMLVSTATSSFASTAGLAGTWQIIDRGPGGWAGGTLREDGTANGSGAFAFKAPDGSQEVASIDAVSWSIINPTTILLCANITGKQGTVFPIGVTIFDCIPLVVSGTGAPIPSLFDPDTFTKVMLK